METGQHRDPREGNLKLTIGVDLATDSAAGNVSSTTAAPVISAPLAFAISASFAISAYTFSFGFEIVKT